MTAGEEPGNAELMRNLESLRGDIRDLSKKLDATAVRKDVYAADRTADALQFASIEDRVNLASQRIDKAEERQTATWRLTLAGLVYPLVVALIVYLIIGSGH